MRLTPLIPPQPCGSRKEAEGKKPKQTRSASKTAQRQKKPSIRAQLKAAKEEQAQKPPQREKSKELEV